MTKTFGKPNLSFNRSVMISFSKILAGMFFPRVSVGNCKTNDQTNDKFEPHDQFQNNWKIGVVPSGQIRSAFCFVDEW